jgi:hypothetical protein
MTSTGDSTPEDARPPTGTGSPLPGLRGETGWSDTGDRPGPFPGLKGETGSTSGEVAPWLAPVEVAPWLPDQSEDLVSLAERVTANGSTIPATVGDTIALPLVSGAQPWKTATKLIALLVCAVGAFALAATGNADGESSNFDDLFTALLWLSGALSTGLLARTLFWIPIDRASDRRALTDPVRQSFATRERGHAALTFRHADPIYAAHVDGDERAGTVSVKLLRYGPTEPVGRARVIFEAITPHEPLERANRTLQLVEAEAERLERAAIDRRRAREMEAVERDATALDVASTVELLRASHFGRENGDQ